MTNSHVHAYWMKLLKQSSTSAFITLIFSLFKQLVVIFLTFYIHLCSAFQYHNYSIFLSWYCYYLLSFENILILSLTLSVSKSHQDSLIVDYSLYNVQECVVSFVLIFLQLQLMFCDCISPISFHIFNCQFKLLL